MDPQGPTHCLLCGSASAFVCVAWRRPVFRCPHCDLRFVPPTHWVTRDAEIARYRLHRNRIDDERYVRFLWPVIDCLKRYGVRGRVLDYGSGPEPVLTELLRREGYDATGFDPHFGACTGMAGVGEPLGSFHAVVSTEVFEHLRDPAAELDRITGFLEAGGLLVIMTSLVTARTRMDVWPYANDETHVAFYSEATCGYLAARWGFEWLESRDGRVVVLRKR